MPTAAEHAPRRYGLITFAVAAGAVVVASLALVVSAAGDAAPSSVEIGTGAVLMAVVMGLAASLGVWLIWTRPRNAVGWVLMAEGMSWLLALAAQAALVHNPDATAAGFAITLLWVPGVLLVALLVLIFPDGRVPSRGWRRALWLVLGAIAANLLGQLVAPGRFTSGLPLVNPIGIDSPALDVFRAVAAVLIPISIVASAASLFVRRRAAVGRERKQISWLLYAMFVVLAGFIAGEILEAAGASDAVVSALNTLPLAAIPIAVAVALLRHRLYDIELIIDRTLLAGVVVAVASVVYVLLAAGLGALIGQRGGSNVWIAALATALAVLGLQPFRGRLQQWSARLAFSAPEEIRDVEKSSNDVPVSIKTLGAFRLYINGQVVPPSNWRSKKARTLLKILVARRGAAVHREQLSELLWPGEASDAVSNRLSVALSTVRAALDPNKAFPPDHFLATDREAVVLKIDEMTIDAEQFLAVADGGFIEQEAGRHDAARIELDRAERLYGGDFLAEDLYEDWADPLREQLNATYVSVERALAQAAAEDGDVDQATRRYLRLLEREPHDENAHLGLIYCLEDSGRHGDAKRRHAVYSAKMAEIGRPAIPLQEPV